MLLWRTQPQSPQALTAPHPAAAAERAWPGRSRAMGWTPPLVTASMCQSGIADQPLEPRGASTMKITTIGIDLAKNVFQVHGVDERGRTVLKKQLKRDQMAAFFAKLPACLIGLEACGSSHHWARKLQGFGHTVRLMAPQFIKPYVKTNKNDAADAEAICEAVARPNMRFVPVKSVEQQAVLSLHRVRQSFVKARTAQANQIRSLLGEFGLVMPKGITNVRKRVPEVLENALTSCLHRSRIWWSDCWTTSRSSIARSANSKRRSRLGIAAVSSARSLRRYPVSDPWAPAHWWPPSLTPGASTTGGKCRRGSDWCRDSIPAAANRPYWGSVSVVTFICARCSFMVRVSAIVAAQRRAGRQSVAARLLPSASSERRSGRAGEQERPHRVGATCPRPGVPASLLPCRPARAAVS